MTTPIRFQYFTNTSNVEYDGPLRTPMNIMYTIMTEIPIPRDTNFIDSIFGINQQRFSPLELFGDASILSFFDNLENILDQSLQTDQNQKERATREMISQLGQYRRVNKDSNLTRECCSICLDNFQTGEGYRTLRCGHDFHKKCIDKWFLEGSQECPMCRKNAWGLGENDQKENESNN